MEKSKRKCDGDRLRDAVLGESCIEPGLVVVICCNVTLSEGGGVSWKASWLRFGPQLPDALSPPRLGPASYKIL